MFELGRSLDQSTQMKRIYGYWNGTGMPKSWLFEYVSDLENDVRWLFNLETKMMYGEIQLVHPI